VRHALGTRNSSERFGNECRIPVGFFKAGFKIDSHFLRRSEMSSNVIARVGRNSAAYCAEWIYDVVIRQVTLR